MHSSLRCLLGYCGLRSAKRSILHAHGFCATRPASEYFRILTYLVGGAKLGINIINCSRSISNTLPDQARPPPSSAHLTPHLFEFLSNLRLIVHSLTQTMGYAPSYDAVIAALLVISLVVVFVARAIRLRPGLGHSLFAPFVQFISTFHCVG